MNSESHHPLSKAAEEYLRVLQDERRLSTSSLRLYSRELRLLFRHLPQPKILEDVRTHLRNSSPATASRKLIIWRSFLETCNTPWRTALDSIQSPKIRQKQPLFLTEDEAFRLEHACYRSKEISRNRLLIGLMLQLGLRLSEVLALKFEDFEGGYIRLMRKGEKEQRLPLSHALATLLANVKQERRPQPTDPVFGGRTQEVLTARGAQVILESLRKLAKIDKKISPHSLRHTFASNLAAKGASLPALKEILGHKKITTTERYLHVTPDHLKETLNLVK